ncbi:MAG: HAMP domain-containing protein, partial [Solirubrobacteraceae bacterium]
MLTRLRWSAFGLRGRIVGAVLITTAVTLVVAGLVLLPRLEDVLRTASTQALEHEVKDAKRDRELARLASIQYPLIADARSSDSSVRKLACRANANLYNSTQRVNGRFGGDVSLIGMIGAQGNGGVLVTPTSPSQCSGSIGTGLGTYENLRPAVAQVARTRIDHYEVTSYQNNPFVEAVIWVSPTSALAVRKSIAEIPTLEAAVGRAFAIAAGAAILMTLLVAIPLAGTLVSRLRRLRQAALRIAIDGSDRARFPVDRARDEVGDLSRSFSIMQRR